AVADAKKQLFGCSSVRETLSEALWGDETVQVRGGKEATLTSRKNGFWGQPGAPRNVHVSGVLLFPDSGIWGLRSGELQPVLAIYPFASQPLPSFFQSLHHFEAEGEKWIFRAGRNFADIIGLPAPWPPD